MKRMLAAVLALCLPLTSACFDVEQSTKLERNLSGTAMFSMTANLEPMVLFMLRMQREMQNQKGEPTAEEIEKAKREFARSGKVTSSVDPSRRALLEKTLPSGVKLLGTSMQSDGLKIKARFNFAFDHISKLAQIDLPDDVEKVMAPKNPMDRPFSGLQVTEEGNTILITMGTPNPVAEQKSQTAELGLPPEAEKQLQEAFKDLRLAFRLEAPFEVIEHNATRREGQALLWEYNLAALEKMTPSQLAQGVRVRFRK